MFILEPNSIALIGASAEEKKLGNYILKNLIESTYKGKIFPVNPKHDELLGLPCYHSILDIKGSVDLAVIVTPASTVTPLAEECGKKKVKTLVVISAGFGETGTDDGRENERKLLAIAEEYDMRIVGPNCLGLLRPSIGLNASFARTPLSTGSISLVSQSGAMAVALLDRAESLQMGFSSVVSIGNKTDLNECDFLEIFEKDTETTVIGLYVESIKDGVRFAEIARRVGQKKPIVLIKSGVSERGAKAVTSHTGALAGSTAGLVALCTKAGIHRASTTEEFIGLLATLSTQPALVSPNICIITNAGGPGVLATDEAERAGLLTIALAEETKKVLKASLPSSASTANPVDVLGDAIEDRYSVTLEACAEDPEVDGIVVLLTPQVMTPCEDIAEAIIAVKKTHPLMPITTAFMGGGAVDTARSILRAHQIPSFETPEEAVRMMASLQRKKVGKEDTDGPTDDDRSSTAHGLLKGKSGLLSESLAVELLSLYGLPSPSADIAHSADEAEKIANAIGLPVIAKISSPDILHKTDIGGVRANLKTAKAVRTAYTEITTKVAKALPSAGINGVLIQKFLPIGSEFIVGGIRDASVGPLVMVGLGGIYTELFKDTTFRIAPITAEEGYEMLTSIKSWKLLQGMRGKAPLAIDSLVTVVKTVSYIMADCPMISEIDLNPVLVGEKDIVIADVKIVVR